MHITARNNEQGTQPLIVVNFTDAQFNELRNDLTIPIQVKLIREIVKEVVQQEKAAAPYLNKADFAKWSGYSVSTINKFIAEGLPVAQIGSIKAIGKDAFYKFMKDHEHGEEN